MSKTLSTYENFLGTWILDPRSCDYQQGEAPQAGTYRISESDGRLTFEVQWTDQAGASQQVEFSGVPNGEKQPFAGGDLADALAIHPVSKRELNSSAYYRGKERMVAQRQLDNSGNAMRVTQVVRFPDGTFLANVGVYSRQTIN